MDSFFIFAAFALIYSSFDFASCGTIPFFP